tara:strand:+ start:1024 stop:1245 length:222 start_codon:yes stop_codon:yes gene_type:complete
MTDKTNTPKLSFEESLELAQGIAAQVAVEFKDQLTSEEDENGPEMTPELVHAMFRRAMSLTETVVKGMDKDPN